MFIRNYYCLHERELLSAWFEEMLQFSCLSPISYPVLSMHMPDATLGTVGECSNTNYGEILSYEMINPKKQKFSTEVKQKIVYVRC